MSIYNNESELAISSEKRNIESKKSLFKFLILSGLGICLFMLPISKDGSMTSGISIATDYIEGLLENYLTQIVFIITIFSSCFTI